MDPDQTAHLVYLKKKFEMSSASFPTCAFRVGVLKKLFKKAVTSKPFEIILTQYLINKIIYMNTPYHFIRYWMC